jgi:hypothetical protein
MKRLILVLAAFAMLLVTASSAGAAPKPTEDDGNHAVYENTCSGGPYAEPTFGEGVFTNGGGVANGTLPTAFFYPEDGSDPILGVSMYRVVEIYGTLDDALAREDALVIVGQGRSNGNGNKAFDIGADITAGIDRVKAKWDVATCETPPIPGSRLADAYPDGGYVDDWFYVIFNYLK